MTWQDKSNGIISIIGGIFLAINCIQLYKDKKVQGTTIIAAAFFALWSIWNLYFFYNLEQWASFIGSFANATANVTWISMAINYTYIQKQLPDGWRKI